MATAPTDLSYGFVAGRYLLAYGDRAFDADSLPDVVPAVGAVRFRWLGNAVAATAPVPTAVIPQIVDARIAEQGDAGQPGDLLDNAGRPGVWLVAGRYEVSFRFVGVTVPSFQVTVGAEHTEAAPLYLPLEAPLVPTPGVRFVINEQVYRDTIAARDEVLAAAGSAAQIDAKVVAAVDAHVEDLDLIQRGDPATLTRGGAFFALADKFRRLYFWADRTGRMHAPLGIETPNAGVRIPPSVPYIAGLYDRASRRWAQNAIRRDGTFTDEAVFEWLRRAERVPGLLDSWRSSMGLSSLAVGYRTAGVPLTLSGGSGGAPWVSTATSAHVRLPVKIAADTKRWRVHLRNHNDRGSLSYPGALAVTGLWFGRQSVATDGSLSGAWAAAPAQVAPAFSTPADGAEWVSPWVTDPAQQITANSEHLLSFGYTAPAQTNHVGLGGSWQSSVATDAGALAPTTPLVQQSYAPLDVWLEVEVDSRVPVVMFVGDSLTVGTGAALPVRDSYANRWALAHGALAQITANHGSTLAEWANSAAWKWQKYASLTPPDAAYLALGSNDVFNGEPASTVQARALTVAGILRGAFSPRLYLSTLLPRNGSATTAAKEAVRVAHNDWLRALPANAVQVFDTAAAVESAPGVVDPRYVDADQVHLNRAGYARKARAIDAPLAVRR